MKVVNSRMRGMTEAGQGWGFATRGALPLPGRVVTGESTLKSGEGAPGQKEG